MNRPLVLISSCLDTYSGYGAKSRGWIRSFIELKKDEFTIQLLSQRWGSTPFGFIDAHPEWHFLKEYIIEGPINQQPDIFIQDTVANEFQRVGKYNIGFCSGIETTACDISWINGCNNMDLIVTSSEHSKRVFESTVFEKRQGDQIVETIRLNKPCVVLFEGFDKEIYKALKFQSEFKNKELFNKINSIPDKFAFLFVGHFLQGEMGEDRKNVGLLIKAFYEIWKNKPNKPALILKTNGASTSYLDRYDIQKKINEIKKSVTSKDLPNIYLLHGEFNDSEINELYNHPKVKAMVSLSKGEGFGRPLLEFSVTGKPIVTSGWSGPLDFLKKDLNALISGELKPIHPSAQVPNILIEGSQWFSPNHGEMGLLITEVFTKYNDWLVKSKKQANITKSNFSKEKMTLKLKEILDANLPVIPKFIPLTLPTKKLVLPTLKTAE